jgi:hypothetical protein
MALKIESQLKQSPRRLHTSHEYIVLLTFLLIPMNHSKSRIDNSSISQECCGYSILRVTVIVASIAPP